MDERREEYANGNSREERVRNDSEDNDRISDVSAEVPMPNAGGVANSDAEADDENAGVDIEDDEPLLIHLFFPDEEDSPDEQTGAESEESDEEVSFDSDESHSEDDDEATPHGTDIYGEFFHLNVERFGLDGLLRAQGNIKKFEMLLLEIAKALRFKACYKSMLVSFKAANLLYDNAHFPTTMAAFWKIVNRDISNFTHSIICTVCWDDLGASKKPNRRCRCGETGPRRTKQMGTVLYLNLTAQLQGLLRRPGMATDLQYPWTRIKRNPAAIEDVYDGSIYRRLSADGGFLCRDSHNYSLAIWTDEIDAGKSPPVTIWPVFVQLLELSPRARQRNSLLAALYVGPYKPHMASFLRPFAMELRNLYLNGISWHPDGKTGVRSRFITLIVAADSEARYQLMGMSRPSAYNGCTYCYASGERLGEQEPYHVYKYRDGNRDNGEDFAADRDDAEIRRDLNVGRENRAPENGVRQFSALCIIPGVDLRSCQLVEGLHCFWVKNFTRLYGIMTTPEIPNHLTQTDIRLISSRIESVRPPTKLGSRPRSLKYYTKYKATEIRNMAWYYWLPCAHAHLIASHGKHFSLFAEVTYILNKDSILPEELDRAEVMLDDFRRQSGSIFPEHFQSYSLHLLKHVVRCTRELGPSWVASGFWFQSWSRQVKNYITSPTDGAMEVADRILLAQMVEKCLDWNLSSVVSNQLREFLHKAPSVVLLPNAPGRSVQHSGGIPGLLNHLEIVALAAAGYDVPAELQIVRYQQVSIDGVIYQPHSGRPLKYDNSVVHVTPHRDNDMTEFIRIISIIKWQRANVRVAGVLGFRYTTIDRAFHTSYMKRVGETRDLVYLPLACINSPAVLVQSLGSIYISPIPNKWDVD